MHKTKIYNYQSIASPLIIKYSIEQRSKCHATSLLHNATFLLHKKDILKYTKEALISSGMGFMAIKIERLFFTALFGYYIIILGSLRMDHGKRRKSKSFKRL